MFFSYLLTNLKYFFILFFCAFSDKLGDTALDLAKAQGHTQVEFLLEGRDPNTGEVLGDNEDIEDEDVDAEPTDL